MIWGNTGYKIVEIDLSFLKTKQDKLHQIRHNLNIYLLKNKKKYMSFKSSHIFYVQNCHNEIFVAFQKKLPIDVLEKY